MFGIVGILFHKSKNQVSFFKDDQLETGNTKKEIDDLYKELEDLFI
tara:strand:- start:304 stop:441 length:138 start_codon:yes stop_codon:yes gene_type:complete